MMQLKKKNKPNPNPADDRQEIIKIKAAINEMETNKQTNKKHKQSMTLRLVH